MLFQFQPEHVYCAHWSHIFGWRLSIFDFQGAESFVFKLLVAGRWAIQNVVDDALDVLGAHLRALLRRFATTFGQELLLVSPRRACTLKRAAAFRRNTLLLARCASLIKDCSGPSLLNLIDLFHVL